METFKFEPSVLKWARVKGFTDHPKALEANLKKSSMDLTYDSIIGWEEGRVNPSFEEVKKLAELYKRPLAVFFLDAPPPERSAPPDKRTIGSKDNKILSSKALLVMRKARKVQEIARGLLEDVNKRPTFKYPKCTLRNDPEKLASLIRNDLGVSLEIQFGHKKFLDFFDYLRSKLETTGILTLKSGTSDSFPLEDCRAFSFADVMPYLILINNKDWEGAKNFSLLHEFAHILLREDAICNDFNSFNTINGISKIETFCNEFAACFLVPRSDLINHKLLLNKKEISDKEIDGLVNDLAKAFKVSRYVILGRLKKCNLISPVLYREKKNLWENEKSIAKSEGGQFSLKSFVFKNGKKYTSLVMEAYRSNRISRSSVSDYLGMKTKHLSKFEKFIAGYEG